jgi:tRNA(Ile2) C34 agmatinyltransferase TiaS
METIINTSVDDLKNSLFFISDMELIRVNIERATKSGQKTMVKLLIGKLNRLEGKTKAKCPYCHKRTFYVVNEHYTCDTCKQTWTAQELEDSNRPYERLIPRGK